MQVGLFFQGSSPLSNFSKIQAMPHVNFEPSPPMRRIEKAMLIIKKGRIKREGQTN